MTRFGPFSVEEAWLTITFRSDNHQINNPFDSKWSIRLRGAEADLADVAEHFGVGKALAIRELSGQYFLYSDVVEQLDDAQDVLKHLRTLLQSVNGTMALLVPGYSSIEVEAIESAQSDGHFTLTTRASEMGEIRRPSSGTRPPLSEIAERLVSLSLVDEAVADVLRILSNGDTDAYDLYKIYEIVRDDVGGQSNLIKVRKWTSNAQIRRFKNSLNNRSVLGDRARHATKTHSPPRKPMGLSEARTFINGLLSQWLSSKSKNP